MKDFFRLKTIYAHCDIPCGIYDPHVAQIAALTTLRMLDLISKSQDAHDISRYASVKEEYAEKCKNEVRIIWGDFFKAEDLSPEINSLFKRIVESASAVKQGKDQKQGEELVDLVNQFAEIFWDKKGIKTRRVPAPYKVEAEVVIPEL
ncbi:MAG: superoxide dismutase, Ni [Candidatus Colwellbacteria bacterium]|nr:superoxide dismutase, Ni [Candidatus Colwellbacteria bacterium]